MRRLAVTFALLAVGVVAGCTGQPRPIQTPSPPALASSPALPASPTPSPAAVTVCARARATTGAVGPAMVQRFRGEGLTSVQVLDRVRALYQLAEADLAGLRARTADARLRAALSAVEAQYRDIRRRLQRPQDVDRVNLRPRALTVALADLNRACA